MKGIPTHEIEFGGLRECRVAKGQSFRIQFDIYYEGSIGVFCLQEKEPSDQPDFRIAGDFRICNARREVPRKTLSQPGAKRASRYHRSANFALRHKPHMLFAHSPRTGGNMADLSLGALLPEWIATILRCC